MEIKSLGKTDFETVFEAFYQAFVDYEVQLNRMQLQTMLKRRGYDPTLSFAAFDKGKIVAFTFNGIGNFGGMSTAYDTGTGTLKDYRGKGLATEVFNYSIPYLKKMGIKQYLLEVLQHNTKAVSVYRNLGFEVTREFNYFIAKNEDVRDDVKNSNTSGILRQIDLEEFDSIPEFWDFTPSWQNSFESIQRATDDFVCLGVFTGEKLVGYCVFEPASGDITQIAVDKRYRRRGIASVLLHEMIKLNQNDTVKIINTDILSPSITDFLKARNIDIQGKQFEMIKQL
ncbi:GNAT family N-acetyltransferase [uncultured Sanguibacteroides sp.]|uniref:GNAT family N-acetyltransferase n=1 Tax=uncultured Sanguibacteroides sp. TaxID=1635151 RepID=UPI0025D03BB4|nr:GNAT family N-acetyltransferase [uncultured Sanguibacteroides sp.]